jgi:hypothetical protein
VIRWEVNRYGRWRHAMSNRGHSFSARTRLGLEIGIKWRSFLSKLNRGRP